MSGDNIVITGSQSGSIHGSNGFQSMNLYDEIKHRLERGSSLESPDIQNICSTINKMSVEHCTVIFMLILHHYLTSGQVSNPQKTLIEIIEKRSRASGITYRGKIMKTGKGIMFKMNDLPADLQMIIGEYIEMVSS